MRGWGTTPLPWKGPGTRDWRSGLGPKTGVPPERTLDQRLEKGPGTRDWVLPVDRQTDRQTSVKHYIPIILCMWVVKRLLPKMVIHILIPWSPLLSFWIPYGEQLEGSYCWLIRVSLVIEMGFPQYSRKGWREPLTLYDMTHTLQWSNRLEFSIWKVVMGSQPIRMMHLCGFCAGFCVGNLFRAFVQCAGHLCGVLCRVLCGAFV